MIAVALNVMALPQYYSYERPVVFGTANDYPPLEYVDPDGTPCGYDIEFTKMLLDRLHLPYECRPMDWGLIPRASIDGDIDLSMMTYSAYRQDSLYYSRPVFKLHYQLVYRDAESNKHMDMRRLNGRKIAYLSSKPISDTLAAVGAIPIIVKNLRQALQQLAEGEYDAVITYRYQVKFITEKYGLKGLTYEDFTLMAREYCYASRDKRLIDAIDFQLDVMEDEGLIYKTYSPAGVFVDPPQVPLWVWYLLIALVILFLLALNIIQRQYQKKIIREMKRAKLNEQAKTAFLGNVSHILRTPLNAINGFSEILMNETGELSAEERHELATLVHDNGQRLLYFITELLTLSDIEGNEMVYKRKDVDLRQLMDELAEEARDKISGPVELTVEGPEKCLVNIDVKQHRIVMTHLLSNAVRFTQKGSIRLKFEVKNGRLHVDVTDTGIGVPIELRANIFDLLNERETAVQDEIPGLGLIICKAIIKHAGGEIALISPREGGSCFTFWVPIRIIK